MRPLSDWPLADRRELVGVFTDIDDTLTTDGAITPDALAALGNLKRAGLHVIPITGRPVGWSEPFARSWPVDAIVAENGAVGLHTPRLPAEGFSSKNWQNPVSDGAFQLQKTYQQDTAARARQFARMQQVAARVLREVPGAQLAQDSPGRETDIAIDHSEFTHLPPDAIARVLAILRSEGMTATVSSIHINGWYGGHNKWDGACWIMRKLLQRDLPSEIWRWAYVGDSTNDQLMFQHFPHSIGVANIRRFEAELEHLPRYITPGERGAGFAQACQAILQAISQPK
ncbi:MAG: HAD-IIB family hydrolase [Burkholderiaceae bacterium]|nr:HAD-IIB family hydrolase [Burkholderiaceae bacterium]